MKIYKYFNLQANLIKVFSLYVCIFNVCSGKKKKFKICINYVI